MLFSFTTALTSCNDSNTITCSSCGEENPDNVKFCSNCGKAFGNDENNGSQSNNGDENNGNQSNNINNSSNGETQISMAKDFLNEIASNKTISLDNVTLSFGDITGINNSCVEKSEYGYYIIKNVDNLTILGSGTTILSTANIEGYFLIVDNCKNNTIYFVYVNSKN